MTYALLSKYRSELMGIAMIAVMLFHATDLETGFYALDQLRSLGFGGVDIFVLLSGLGLAMSLSRREQEYGRFMARRSVRLLPAYFLVMLPYTLFLFLTGRAPLSTFVWNSTLLNYWVRCEGGFNWYITGIMTLYVLTPPAVKLLRARPGARIPLLLGVTVGSFLVSQILMRDSWWYHLDIIYRVPIYTAGLVLGLHVAEGRGFSLRDGIVWGVSLALGVVYAWVRPSLGSYAQGTYIFAFTTIPACLIFAWCMDKLPLGWLWRALRFLGENSLEIYLLNVSLFSEIALLRRFFDPGPGHYAYYAASFALNILLGWTLHKAVGLAAGRLRGKKAADSPGKF